MLTRQQEDNLAGVAIEEVGYCVRVRLRDLIKGRIQKEGLVIQLPEADPEFLHLDVEASAEAGQGHDVSECQQLGLTTTKVAVDLAVGLDGGKEGGPIDVGLAVVVSGFVVILSYGALQNIVERPVQYFSGLLDEEPELLGTGTGLLDGA